MSRIVYCLEISAETIILLKTPLGIPPPSKEAGPLDQPSF
jgi:hypothetical protein